MSNRNPRWMTRLLTAGEWGFATVVTVAVILWLVILPLLGVRCWMAH